MNPATNHIRETLATIGRHYSKKKEMIKQIVIVFSLVILTVDISGQIAIINDEDGYTNVRETPDIKSNIIYKLYNYELFIYDVKIKNEDDEWIEVYIPKNKYSLDNNGLSSLVGYIHKSRLKAVEELESYKGDEFSFNYNLGPFSFENKIIDYDDKWISRINGRPFYGTDGDAPNNEILSIDIQINENKITVPEILYQDLFEINDTFNIYKIDDIYFVEQWNSDGAGGYLLVWAIDNTTIRQRLIMIP